MFSTILVPVDLAHPDWAKNALCHVDGVDDDNIRIILLYVVEDLPSYVTGQLPEHVLLESRDKQLSKLEAFAREAGSNVVAEIRNGSPAATILKVAEQKEADLIVIGSHQPGLKDYFLGSTASRVVRHAKCSVLVSR